MRDNFWTPHPDDEDGSVRDAMLDEYLMELEERKQREMELWDEEDSAGR